MKPPRRRPTHGQRGRSEPHEDRGRRLVLYRGPRIEAQPNRPQIVTPAQVRPRSIRPGIEPGRVPVGHALEVRPIGVRITNALDDRQPPALEQLGHGFHCRVQTQPITDPQEVFGRQAQHLSVPRIALIRVRHDGVDPIIAPCELDDDEDPFVALRTAGAPVRCRKAGTLGDNATSAVDLRNERREAT